MRPLAVLAVCVALAGCGSDDLSAQDKVDLLCAQQEDVTMCRNDVSDVEAEAILKRLRLEGRPDSFFTEP